jgi:hypothetical protein
MRGEGIIGAVGGAVLIMAATSSAVAQEACARLDLSAPVPAAWQAAVGELRARLARNAQRGCTPMVLSLEVSGDGGRIVATANDGRRTERPLHGPDALVATALGLTAAIPADEPAAPQAQPASSAAAPLPSPPSTPPTPPSPTPPPPPQLGLWMGLAAGVRLTAPTSATALDVEARADLDVGPWLVIATVRSALVSCLGVQGLDCDAYTDVGGGIGVGRRVRAGATSIDFAFEPLVMAMHIEYDLESEEDASIDKTELALLLDLSTRLSVPLGRRWALTVAVDGALAPTLLANPVSLQLPTGSPITFPAWTGGVRVGASGALL